VEEGLFMNLQRMKTALFAMALGLTLAAAPAPGPDAACLSCHGQKSMAGKFVDNKKFEGSVHGGNGCTSCHASIDVKDHPGKPVTPVDCAACHDKPAATYAASMHGKARKGGNTGAAQCSDCHGTHEIMKANAPTSPVRRENLGATCGQCHPDVVKEVGESIHGQAMANGVREAPGCTDCHSDHAIESLKTASPMKVSSEVCSRCHGSTRMNEKFSLPTDRVTTFFESYHGMAAKMGSPKAANCASCHGFHRVLPASDPRSMVNKANLVQTCQKCHANANEKFSFGTIHESRTATPDLGSKIDKWVRSIYLSMIFAVIGGMVVHNLLILRKKAMASYRDPHRTVVRMTLAARIQHGMLASSFIFLVVSGFALKYPETLHWLMGGSETFRRLGHRAAACVMIVGAIGHVFFVIFTKEGRKFVWDMLPEVKDVTDVITSLKYYLIPGSAKPEFKRFGYAEKAEYWAVVWGTFLMGATGLLIWFKMHATQWLPRWAVDVSITVHYYEAILATLAILVWHFYFVIFDPEVYPINWAFLDGKVTPHHYKEEHGLDTDVQYIPGHGPEVDPSEDADEEETHE
jgi:cytochrome b subunit of formate dehydrogenase/nitrate/TMAO reductase-like tetraheme cytochrome c subunit